MVAVVHYGRIAVAAGISSATGYPDRPPGSVADYRHRRDRGAALGCFYGSIKYSNVSVGLLCFSAVGFFTAIIEPLVLGHRVDIVELLLGLMVIVGIFFIFQVDPAF